MGRRVVVAADVFGQPVERLRLKVARRLEHEMLEQMREARAAGGIVLAADVIPHLDRHVGRVGVANRVDAQAVGQRALGERDGFDLRCGSRLRMCGERGGEGGRE